MVDSWRANPLFSSWMLIIKDALDAHCEGKYTLSVPALFPAIEGILIEYVKVKNLLASYRRIRKVYEAVIGNPDDYGLTSWAIASTLLYHLKNNTEVTI